MALLSSFLFVFLTIMSWFLAEYVLGSQNSILFKRITILDSLSITHTHMWVVTEKSFIESVLFSRNLPLSLKFFSFFLPSERQANSNNIFFYLLIPSFLPSFLSFPPFFSFYFLFLVVVGNGNFQETSLQHAGNTY